MLLCYTDGSQEQHQLLESRSNEAAHLYAELVGKTHL